MCEHPGDADALRGDPSLLTSAVEEAVRCYPSVADLPEAADVLAVGVNHTRVLEHIRLAAQRGVRAAIIFDGGFAERGEEGRRRQEELVAICREAGIALCGPNCMGVVSPHARSLVYIQTLADPTLLAGNVGLVSQSGSLCIGLLADCRRFAGDRRRGLCSIGNPSAVRRTRGRS